MKTRNAWLASVILVVLGISSLGFHPLGGFLGSDRCSAAASTTATAPAASVEIEESPSGDPRSTAASQAYANFRRGQGSLDEALAQAERLLGLVPENPLGLQIAGCCYVAKGEYKTAEDYLNRGIKAHKANAGMYTIMAGVKDRLGRHDQAMAILRLGLENTKGSRGYADVLSDLVNSLINDQKFDEAEKRIKELQGLGYRPDLAELYHARLAIVKGDWNVAKAALVEVLPKLRDDPALQKVAYQYLGLCYQRQGDVEKQIAAYSAAVKIDPYFAPAREGLAEAFMARGKLADAAEQYRILLNGPHPDLSLEVKFARIAIIMRLRQDKAKREWEPVDKLLDRIEQEKSAGNKVAVLKAEVLLAKDLPDEAEKLLKQYSTAFPQSAPIWTALIRLAMHQAELATNPADQQSKWRQASNYIDQAEKVLGDNLTMRTEHGSFAVRRKDPHVGAVLKELGDAKGLEKWSDSDRVRLFAMLSTLSNQAGDLDLARYYSGLVAEKEPANINVRNALCQLDLQAYEKGQTPDLQELDKCLAELKNLAGEGPFWLYGKAVRTFVQSRTPDAQMLLEARSYLQKALELRKDWAAPAVLAGKICELQKEPDQALEFYYRAIFVMGDRSSDVIRRTVHLLLPRGGYEEARRLFVFLEQQKSSILGEMNQEYALVKVFTGDIAEAEREVEKSVAADSKSYQDFLRQGELYVVLAQRLKKTAQDAHRDWKADREMLQMAQRALGAFAQARLLNPQSEEVYLAIVRLIVAVGQPDRARPWITAAEAALKGEKAAVTLAACYAMLDEPKKAQAFYEAAAKIAPQDRHILRQVAAFYLGSHQFALAEPVLRRMIDLQTPATSTDACWARRSLAGIRASQGDFRSLCQALALVDENLRVAAWSTDDKRAKAHYLVADPRKEKLHEAIQVLEDLVKANDATPDDRFGLAELYLKTGDWTSYRNLMHSLLSPQIGAPKSEYLVAYINSLLERKELDEAIRWLETLEKTAPNVFGTARLKAEYQFLCGSYSAASNLALAFLDNPRAQPQDHGRQLLLVAALLEEFGDRLTAQGKPAIASGFLEKADSLFASLRSVSKSGDIYFAAHLAKQKRTRDCLELLEQFGDKYPAEDLQLPAVAMLEAKAADPSQYQRLEKILVAAASKSNRSISLLMVLAELHERQRQFDKSIADYREVLAKQPQNYKAINNLGLSLARGGQNLDEALKLIDDALAIRGPMAEVLDSRALVHIARQEPDKALEDLAASIHDEGSGEQYFHQAWAYWLAGKKTEAATAFATAKKKGLDPKNLDPHEVPVFERFSGIL